MTPSYGFSSWNPWFFEEISHGTVAAKKYFK